MSTYELPDELQVESDGPVRVITLNRPEQLNATNHVLHGGLAALFPQLDADDEARVAVITGAGRAFSAGGDFGYIDELSKDAALRHLSLTHGRQIVTGMVGCRVPIIAAVNGPAVGLGCSLVALSDIVFMAESAHLADPHVLIGLVAADGGPVVWPLLTSLQLAKEYALTGDRIPAERAAAIGLVNHVVPDAEVLPQAMACAQRIARLPKGAVEDTKRVINIQLERAVLAALDFALSAEDRSFTTPELRANIERMRSVTTPPGGVTPSAAQADGGPLRFCAARPASQPPSAWPAVETCSSIDAARGRTVAARHGVEERGVLAPTPLLLLGEELEVVVGHDAHGLAQVREEAGRARGLVDAAVEVPVGRDHVVRAVDGVGQHTELGQLGGRDAGGGHLRRLAGQRGQDGEVVHGVLGADTDDRDAAPGRDGDEALVGELEQRLADRGPADPELGRQVVEVEAVAGLEAAREDPFTELAGRLGPDCAADQFDI